MSGSARPEVTAAVIAALAGDAALVSALGGSPKVWVNVPDGTVAPYLWVLGGEEIPIERTMGGHAHRRGVGLEVTAVSSHRGTAEVDALISRVIEVVLAGPAVAGYTPVWRFVVNRRPVQVEVDDGTVAWMGTVLFEVQLV